MLGVEQTGLDIAASTEEWNSATKMDFLKLNFSNFFESSEKTRGKSCSVYMVQKKSVRYGIIRRKLQKKFQRVALALESLCGSTLQKILTISKYV